MIPYKNRFHGLNGLRFVYAKGKTVRSQLLALKFVDNPRHKDYKLAVVVSKKVNKSAVKRNRIRRRLYEIVRQNQQLISQPLDLVLTVYSDDILKISPKELEETVVKLLMQAV